MKIGIDGNEANIEDRVGVNQYAHGLLTALEKLPETRGHEFIIYFKDQPRDHMPEVREGWQYKVLPGSGMWIIKKLMPHLWLAADKPDVFFSPGGYTPLFSPVPLVVSIMDLGYLRFPEQFRKYDFYQLKYWGWWSMRIAKKIIAISESTKHEILEHYPWSRGKVEVTYPGYDREKYQISKIKNQNDILKIKKKYGITSDYILFLSTLKPSKNVEGLLEAFRLLLTSRESRVTSYQLVIAGKKGWLFNTIFQKVKELGLENFVIFTDFVPEEDKAGLLVGAKVLVSPSFWEGFGMHVLEAMSVGTPVVASNVGSLPEVVGNSGVLVNPQDYDDIAAGITKAIANHDKLSKYALAQATRFSWEDTARKTLAILESVLK